MNSEELKNEENVIEEKRKSCFNKFLENEEIPKEWSGMKWCTVGYVWKLQGNKSDESHSKVIEKHS